MKKNFLILIFIWLVPQSAFAQTYEGKVISIADGDTLTILTVDKDQHKIRLAEIDTPEKGQPFANQAKKKLSSLTYLKEVTVQKVDTDRYGRIVGHIYVGDIHVNKEMVSSGMAWVYRKYMKDKSLLSLEEQAKSNNLGLWSSKEASIIPPWKWRNQNQGSINQAIKNKQVNTNDSSSYSCSGKKYCGQMTSCNEAKHYLNNCNLSRLDGDGDGVPCESICR